MGDYIIEKGSVLKEIRESKGISLESVHQDTKIPMDALKAIEEGYSIRTLSPFYLNGFAKMYAQYLDVDVKKVLKEHKKEKIPEPISTKKESLQFGPPLGYLIKEKLDGLFIERRKHQIGKVLFAILAVFLLSKLFAAVGHKDGPKTKENRPAKKAAVSQPVEKKSEISQPPADSRIPETSPTAGVSAAPVEQKTAKRNITLSVRARQDGWLQVTTDGDIVFQSVLKKGMTETWNADKEIELSGRNVSQLEFELNGKVIGTLGREDRSAKRVIFTKHGLSVKK